MIAIIRGLAPIASGGFWAALFHMSALETLASVSAALVLYSLLTGGGE